MKLLGSLVNVLTIIAGSCLGLLFKKGIPKRFSDILTKGMALCVVYIGISGSLKCESPLVLVISVAIGAFFGELLDLDKKMNRLGTWVQSKFKKQDSPIAEGFVTASLLFIIGAMAVVGSLQSGLTGDHSTLFTKSIIDGVSSVVFASQLGFGVMLSAIPVFIYQGVITLFSGILKPVLTDRAIAEMTCSGSLLILGIGLNMLGITKIKVANYLPAIVFSAIFAQLAFFY